MVAVVLLTTLLNALALRGAYGLKSLRMPKKDWTCQNWPSRQLRPFSMQGEERGRNPRRSAQLQGDANVDR